MTLATLQAAERAADETELESLRSAKFGIYVHMIYCSVEVRMGLLDFST